MSQVGACGRSIKKPANGGFFNESENRTQLFDFGFLVNNVFANRRVEFSNLDFLRVEPLVLGRRIEVPGSCR